MATFPLAQSARMLGIHPKTLHHWLKEANLPLVAHPIDARIKCVAQEHLQEVAKLHGRPLSDPLPAPFPDECVFPDLREEQAQPLPTNEAEPDHASGTSLAGLIQKVSCLETKIGTLQEQLTQLALALLQERERTVEHRIAALESLVQSRAGKLPLADPQEQGAGQESAGACCRERQLFPAEQLARSRLPALIEYSAQGTYVIINSQDGELHLVPDSAEWFEWLATIPSFRFVGQQGRFTAYRHSRSSCSWRAHRVIHQRTYKQTLGVTNHLTLHRLEQVAAALQSDMAVL